MSTSPVHALDAAHYTDATRFERERDRVFRRTWQFAGYISQLEHPGDCFALDLHGRSLFCVIADRACTSDSMLRCRSSHAQTGREANPDPRMRTTLTRVAPQGRRSAASCMRGSCGKYLEAARPCEPVRAEAHAAATVERAVMGIVLSDYSGFFGIINRRWPSDPGTDRHAFLHTLSEESGP